MNVNSQVLQIRSKQKSEWSNEACNVNIALVVLIMLSVLTKLQ